MDAALSRLYPTPNETRPLRGLYLAHDLRSHGRSGRPYIYSDFVASLDGRIALTEPDGRHVLPSAIRHPHDWRLYLELAAQADAVLISVRRLRELTMRREEFQSVPDLAQHDLAAWRDARGLAPQPACIVVSTSLDIPLPSPSARAGAEFVVLAPRAAARDDAAQFRAASVDLVLTPGTRVTGDDVYRVAAEHGFTTVDAIGGPEVLYTLLAAGRLDRLYLSVAIRCLGGFDYDTLTRGAPLSPPFTPQLHEMYFDPPTDSCPGLLFMSLDRTTTLRL